MNYITSKIREAIESKEYRRKKAVFLATRIKKANQSPGFNWDKAVKGFADQFLKEGKAVILQDHQDYPEHPEEPIEWIDLILYFSEELYNRDQWNDQEAI